MGNKYNIEIEYKFKINKYLSKGIIKLIVGNILEFHKVKEANLSIAVLSKADMIAINKKYLDSEAETDVIAFDYDENPPKKKKFKPADDNCDVEVFFDRYKITRDTIDGEIVINGELAVNISKEFEYSPDNEIMLYIIHGLLHIIGYDDMRRNDREIMFDFQNLHMSHYINGYQNS